MCFGKCILTPTPNRRQTQHYHKHGQQRALSTSRHQLEAAHPETLETVERRELYDVDVNVSTQSEVVKLDAADQFGGAYALKSENILFCPIEKVMYNLQRLPVCSKLLG